MIEGSTMGSINLMSINFKTLNCCFSALSTENKGVTAKSLNQVNVSTWSDTSTTTVSVSWYHMTI